MFNISGNKDRLIFFANVSDQHFFIEAVLTYRGGCQGDTLTRKRVGQVAGREEIAKGRLASLSVPSLGAMSELRHLNGQQSCLELYLSTAIPYGRRLEQRHEASQGELRKNAMLPIFRTLPEFSMSYDRGSDCKDGGL